MFKSCRSAHSRYVAALEKKKNATVSQVKSLKQAFQTAIKSLENNIKEYSIAAEKENNLTLLTKANSFRVTVRHKKETLSSLENTCVKLNEEHKQI